MNYLVTVALAVAGAGWCAGDEFARWTWRHPSPLGNTLYSIVHAEDLFVAVGAHGDILTSPDGLEWTIENSGTVRRFLGVTHGDGKFVAYGFEAALAVSPDGHDWALPGHNLPTGIRGVAYGANRWALLDEYGNIRSSEDLLDWTMRVASVQSSFSDLIFAQEKFVAVGNRGVIMTSTNAIDWAHQDSGTLAWIWDIAYAEGRFVAVGGSDESSSQGIILTSNNAVDWFIQFTAFPLYGVAHGPNGFTLVGGSGFGASCGESLTSTDGLYFEGGPSGCDSGINSIPNDVACNDQVCVAIGFGGAISVSENGREWTPIQEGDALMTLRASAASAQTLVAVGGPGAILVSTDGHSFSRPAMPGYWRAVATDGNAFVAVGEDGVLAESVDGLDWALEDPLTTDELLTVVHGPAGWLAGGGAQSLLHKAPGSNWQAIAPVGVHSLYRLKYSSRLDGYVALGARGMLRMSTDGHEWAPRIINTSETLVDFVESPDRFLLVSFQRAFLSEDSFTWTEVNAGTVNLTSALYHNGVFVIGAGFPRNLMISADGVNWLDRSPGAPYLTGLSSFRGSVYAVGNNGMILQSGRASIPRFELFRLNANGGMMFDLFGEIGRDYELESSTDLVTWDRELEYQQSQRIQPLELPTGPDQRFYRVKLKEP